METPLRLGIAGLGTVGAGVIKIIRQKAALLEARAARPVAITAVSARSRDKDRSVPINDYAWEDDPVKLAQRDDIDVFVELMGGHEGAAKEATEAALRTGKHVVTANKALLAHHGQALAELAEDAGQMIRFEAAVAGGIPVIKTLTESLAGNDMMRIIGVMNGTCNYILTRMQSAGLSYDEVFEEARELGYLEADPNLDVDAVQLEGIQSITIEDINHAADMGYRIKLLGVCQLTGRGLEQRMSPCLVPAQNPLGQLEGGTNMCVLEGDQVEQIILRGPGAGEGPTASAVMGDVMDVARGLSIPTFGVPARSLKKAAAASTQTPAAFYLRMQLLDKPGSMAKISTLLAEAGISIDRMRQYRHDTDTAPVLFVTHKTMRPALDEAIRQINKLDVVKSDVVALRIEDQ